MKSVDQPLNSLMKFSPANDVFQEPKQTYTCKGGWFSVNTEIVSDSVTFKVKRSRQKKN